MTEKCEPGGIETRLGWQSHLKIGAVVSVLYVWAYYMTVSIISPIQGALLPSVIMSLLFLPHGVRVLAAWIYGWRSVAYLLPGVVGCNLHFAGDQAFSPGSLTGMALSLVAAPLAFAAVRGIVGARVVTVGTARLQTVVLTGFAASVFNLLGLKLAYGLRPLEGVVIFVGDASGLIVSVLIVWAVLNWLGRRRSQP